MNKYPSYKPSGIEWLEKIPEHWKSSKLKYLGDLYGGLTGKSGVDFNNDENPKNKPYIPFTNISNNTYISKDHFHYVSIDEGESQNLVKKYDMFFLMSSETYQDLGKSCILIEDVDELYLNSFCKGYRIKEKNIFPLFLNYQILGHLHREMISVEGKGFTRINLRQDKVNDLVIFFPPLSEQHQIVKFLDEKTGVIDKLISTKERKIELLKEQRTSLINQVITRGLDPKVKMKDSGVEWVGEIPNNWTISRLDFLCNLYGRVGWKSLKSEEYVDDGFIFLSTPNIKNKEIDYKNVNYITHERYFESPEIMLSNGDVLLVKDGSTLGIVNIVRNLPSPSTVNSSIGVLKNKSDLLLQEYLYYFLSSYYSQNIINRIKGGMGVPHLFQSDIKKFYVLLPNVKEQQQIVNHLDKYTEEIDDLVSLEQKKIDLLKEYRQSLVSEVITGKMDVRTNVN